MSFIFAASSSPSASLFCIKIMSSSSPPSILSTHPPPPLITSPSTKVFRPKRQITRNDSKASVNSSNYASACESIDEDEDDSTDFPASSKGVKAVGLASDINNNNHRQNGMNNSLSSGMNGTVTASNGSIAHQMQHQHSSSGSTGGGGGGRRPSSSVNANSSRRKSSIAQFLHQTRLASVGALRGIKKALHINQSSNYNTTTNPAYILNRRRRSSVRKKTGLDRDLIEMVRDHILETIDSEIMDQSNAELEKGGSNTESSHGSNLSFHELDIERMRGSDDLIIRYILEYFEDHPQNENSSDKEESIIVEKVSETIIDCLKWRKEFGVNDFKDEDFPIEFYTSGIVLLGEDSDETIVVYIRAGKYKKISANWTPIFLKFMVHESEKTLRQLFGDPMNPRNPPGNKPAIILDCTGVGMAQVDMTLLLGMLPIFTKYFPQSFSYIWIYELHWLCKPVLNIAMKLIPARHARKLKIMDKKSALNEMGPEGIPKFMGGKNPVDPKKLDIPEKCSTVVEIGTKHGLSQDEITKMLSHLKHIS